MSNSHYNIPIRVCTTLSPFSTFVCLAMKHYFSFNTMRSQHRWLSCFLALTDVIISIQSIVVKLIRSGSLGGLKTDTRVSRQAY